MQDIHPLGSSGAVGGGGGRLFGGGGDRRLRPNNHQHQALKCPRCDSINTKFCYYNNYNLSQPRHFCKGCRRYWTKGGVLRNVPVGGGCRKAKRSNKPKPPPPSSLSTTAATTSAAGGPNKSNSHSSSESSSLTATTNTTTTAAAEVVSGVSSSNSAPALFNFPPDSRFFIPQTTNPIFDPPLVDHQSSDGGSMFPEIGTFTGMMTSSTDASPLGFNVGDISSYQLQTQNQGQIVENQSLNQQGITGGGYFDQTAQFLHSRASNGGLAGVDWQGGGGDQDHEDQVMFDLTGTVDQAYWSQTQWPDHNDHSLHYLP